METRLETYRLKPIGLREGKNIERTVGDNRWMVKADRLNKYGIFVGRLIVTLDNPREILETTEEGFVIARGPFDFV